MADVQLALLQTDPVFGAVQANLDALDAAFADLRADLVVLPELFATGYAFRDRAEALELSESAGDGPTIDRLRTWSQQTGGVIVAGYPERAGDQLYNAAAVVAGGTLLQSYRKVHLFGFERDCFDPGPDGFEVIEYRGLRVGTMICFDWIYPEAARCLALGGADVIAHPSNLVLPGWCQRAMEIRALENQVFTVTANRFGAETRAPHPELQFTGHSQIVSPRGEVLAKAPAAASACLREAVDVQAARHKTISSGNHLFTERRPDVYKLLTNARSPSPSQDV